MPTMEFVFMIYLCVVVHYHISYWQFNPPTSKEKKNCFTLLFVTGGVYVDYMVNRSVSPTSYPVKNVEKFFVTFSQ